MTLNRRCLEQGCRSVGYGTTRCPAHTRGLAARKNMKRAAAPGDGAARRARRVLVDAGLGQCDGCRDWHSPPDLEIDHVKALADGGHDIAENLQVLCKLCHRAKSAAENKARRQTTN